ncbi:Ech-type complex subunit Ech2A1 [Thermoanaerobacter kivui]|uniref:Ech-type complex subunit Ech2A1 n=2 Tax=Thermoanaerobacter kivui TaxID=2325 RepID=A0A097ATI1_THEKI|nr:Ech-type complex subunit Ech2A1 [Thermoanaerobacter kivui]
MLLAISVGILFLGALLSVIFYKINSARFHGTLSILTSFISLVGIVYSLLDVLKGKETVTKISISPALESVNFDLILKADGLNMFFALFGAFVSFCVIIYATQYMEHEKEGLPRFFAFTQLFVGAYTGLVLSDNLIWSYIFFELTGLCSYQLIGFWYKRDISSFSAKKAYLMTHIAGYGFLFVVIFVSFLTRGNTIISELINYNLGKYENLILVGLLIAVIAKSVQWPLYTWIPYAMNAPTPVSALLHAACLVKAGVYLLIRFYSVTGPYSIDWKTFIAYLGMLSSLVGVLYALKQSDFKKLLAFHTVSQIGYMVSGIGIGTPIAIAAGLFHVLNHSLFKSLLFLVAGILQHATGSRDISEMGGLSKRLPKTAAVFMIGAASISGLPGFNGYVSKWMFYTASIQAGFPVIAAIGLIASTLTTISFLKVMNTAFYGKLPKKYERIDEKDYRVMIFSSGLLSVPCIVIGVFPQLVIKYLLIPALKAVNLNYGESQFQLYNYGILLKQQANYPATLMAFWAVVAVFIGFLIYVLFLKRYGSIKEAEVFTGGEAEESLNLTADDFVVEIENRMETFYKYSDPDRYFNIANKWISKAFYKSYDLCATLEKKGWSVALIIGCCVLALIIFCI